MSLNVSDKGYEAVIGLEIHAQLKTQSKMFCSDSTTFEAGDNENTSPVSVGLPGSLPVVNKKAIEYSVKTGLALGCQIRRKSVFSRKNYFYPDLSKGYQISQYDLPICYNGSVRIKTENGYKRIPIERAHMEEDAGKSTHQGDYTLINYNRAGIPLLEIVSGPDMHSAIEAATYARTVWQIVRYLGVCDGNLEEGSLRCDVNVSVRKVGVEKLGTKVEIKNINSFRFIEKAIDFEIERQIDVLESGQKIIQETRLFDPDKNKTFSMRTKEDAQDYRYFPDPDLLPIQLTEDYIENIQKTLPELPLDRSERFQKSQGLPEADAAILTSEKSLADYFERAALQSGNPKSTANWIMTEVLKELNASGKSILDCPVSPEYLGKLIHEIDQGQISGKMAKVIFQDMWSDPRDPLEIIKEKGLVQISNTSEIEKIVDQVLKLNSSAVAEYRSGKIKLLGFFVGAIMKETKGKANPEIVNEILNKKLSNHEG